MHIDQGDLLQGMSMIFVKEFMDIAMKESHSKGDFLFKEGEPATHFYTLIKGYIKLSISETGHKVYMVNKAGEAFGWSSLVGREALSASAECMEDTVVLKFDKEELGKLLESHPENGLIFYRKLSEILGNRLLESYKMISQTP